MLRHGPVDDEMDFKAAIEAQLSAALPAAA
jgi:hypothetical protein